MTITTFLVRREFAATPDFEGGIQCLGDQPIYFSIHYPPSTNHCWQRVEAPAGVPHPFAHFAKGWDLGASTEDETVSSLLSKKGGSTRLQPGEKPLSAKSFSPGLAAIPYPFFGWRTDSAVQVKPA